MAKVAERGSTAAEDTGRGALREVHDQLLRGIDEPADREGARMKEEALAECIAAIVVSLKQLGYQNAQYAQMQNECGQLILANSPDGTTHFAIQVRTWEPVK